MPGASVFIDSNVLLYARDIPAGEKSEVAANWVRRLAAGDRARANLQVLNEVTHVMLRKRRNLTREQIFAEIDGLRPLGTSPVGEATVLAARDVRASTGYSWWDCLLLASALELGCTHFLSEDLQDGQAITSERRVLTILDPFAHSPDQILAP